MSNGDPAAPLTFKAVAWTMITTNATTTSAVTSLAVPAGSGSYSAAYGNNNSGAIVGELEESAGGAIVAAYWPNRAATPGQVVLLQQGTAPQGAAYGINTSGRMVGELNDGAASSAVTWSGPLVAPVTLPAAAGQLDATAFFINDAGEIVGELTDATGIHAALWRPNVAGAYVDVPLLLPASTELSGDSSALAINTNGVIVGEATDTSGNVHATRWTPGPSNVYTLADLGATDGGSSAVGINDSGRTVGHAFATANATPTARTWAAGSSAGTALDAALGSSQAYAINATNRVVGMSGTQAFVAVPR
jgi:probable HAF family extracellular repeat protein